MEVTMTRAIAEYIWLDGVKPTAELRSKSRVIEFTGKANLDIFPEWGFDGSSTNQATGDKSDCILKPVNFVSDPIRGEGNFLVMCEVYDKEGLPHPTNTRAILRRVLQAGAAAHEPMVGFEKEYTLFQDSTPLGFPLDGYPRPQGPYYCGVGANRAFGREIVERHTQACIDADILIYGINAEVMPGQWEFQIGYRGFEGDNNDVLNASDHLWIAVWLMSRIAEDFGVTVSYSNKPMKGDWNGAGCHTNFSTKLMRDAATGKETIKNAIDALSKKHSEHIIVYGANNDERLTGAHETCSINEFRSGVSDRGASIRIPLGVEAKGYGYLEDRRPGANSDPYLVTARILTTICGFEEAVFTAPANKV